MYKMQLGCFGNILYYVFGILQISLCIVYWAKMRRKNSTYKIEMCLAKLGGRLGVVGEVMPVSGVEGRLGNLSLPLLTAPYHNLTQNSSEKL